MATPYSRPVRIHLAMQDGPVPRAIKQVLVVCGSEGFFTYVDTQEGADLILFTDVRRVEAGFRKDAFYAFIRMSPHERMPQLPENAKVIGINQMLASLLEIINSVGTSLTPLPEKPVADTGSALQDKEVPLLPHALDILVIDDMPNNLESAQKLLAGHRLIMVNGYQSAMEVMSKCSFNVVLTDLHLPMSSKTMGDKFKLGELVPYGVLLMIEAARCGAKHVAVVTDLSHHDDPFSAAFDHYAQFPITIEGARVLMMHAPMQNGSKDWKTALDQLLKK